MRATLGLIAGLLLCVGDVAGLARVAVAASDRPTITPASGGAGVPLVYGHFEDLDAIGYETTEFFISGNAHSYTTAEPLTARRTGYGRVTIGLGATVVTTPPVVEPFAVPRRQNSPLGAVGQARGQ